MKKIKNIVGVLLIMSSGIALSQVNHLAGQKQVFFSGGLTEYSKNMSFNLGYQKFTTNAFFWSCGMSFEKGNITSASFENYRIKGSYNYSPLAFSESKNSNFILNRIFLNSGLGLVGQLENVRSDIEADKRYSTLGYGLFVDLELEVFISSSIVLFSNARQHYILNSKLGNWFWEFNYGLKFII